MLKSGPPDDHLDYGILLQFGLHCNCKLAKVNYFIFKSCVNSLNHVILFCLNSMMAASTWGDQMILHGTATAFVHVKIANLIV